MPKTDPVVYTFFCHNSSTHSASHDPRARPPSSFAPNSHSAARENHHRQPRRSRRVYRQRRHRFALLPGISIRPSPTGISSGKQTSPIPGVCTCWTPDHHLTLAIDLPETHHFYADHRQLSSDDLFVSLSRSSEMSANHNRTRRAMLQAQGDTTENGILIMSRSASPADAPGGQEYRQRSPQESPSSDIGPDSLDRVSSRRDNNRTRPSLAPDLPNVYVSTARSATGRVVKGSPGNTGTTSSLELEARAIIAQA
ncbi:hypothetical protein BJ166DRAFT_495793 [Pestalotiopsis sp. NC0098]|nr:hypothetical protein BJ166DRAFT_495793 [Pestalotiopsis sp. NC0098]